MSNGDEAHAKSLANQFGLDLVETRFDRDGWAASLRDERSINHRTRHVFVLRPIVDKHHVVVLDRHWKRGYLESPGAYIDVLRSVRAKMRVDTLRALLDDLDSNPIDLLGSGMASADAYELCKRVATQLMEKAGEYRK